MIYFLAGDWVGLFQTCLLLSVNSEAVLEGNQLQVHLNNFTQSDFRSEKEKLKFLKCS